MITWSFRAIQQLNEKNKNLKINHMDQENQIQANPQLVINHLS